MKFDLDFSLEELPKGSIIKYIKLCYDGKIIQVWYELDSISYIYLKNLTCNFTFPCNSKDYNYLDFIPYVKLHTLNADMKSFLFAEFYEDLKDDEINSVYSELIENNISMLVIRIKDKFYALTYYHGLYTAIGEVYEVVPYQTTKYKKLLTSE